MKHTTPEPLQLDAFVDGELELASQLDMERRLQDDDALRIRVDGLRQLRAALRDGADYHAAPAALRGWLEAKSNMAALPATPALPSAHARDRRASNGVAARGSMSSQVAGWFNRFGWKGLATASSFVAVVAIGLDLALLQGSAVDRLSEDVVASHVRSTVGEHLVDVASSDHHTVKPFLSAKLGFSPPVTELGIPGSSLIGGRVDYLDGRPVAALVYHQGLHTVNSFVWPSKAGESQPSFSADRGFQIAHWTQGGMAHWVISDVNREEFQSVVLAIRGQDTRR